MQMRNQSIHNPLIHHAWIGFQIPQTFFGKCVLKKYGIHLLIHGDPVFCNVAQLANDPSKHRLGFPCHVVLQIRLQIHVL